MQTKTNSNTKKSEPTIAFGGKAEPASGEQKALTENQIRHLLCSAEAAEHAVILAAKSLIQHEQLRNEASGGDKDRFHSPLLEQLAFQLSVLDNTVKKGAPHACQISAYREQWMVPLK